MSEACELAQNNLRSVQSKIKERYDKYTQSRFFQPGDQVLALLPVPGKLLKARYFGSYVVKEKVSNLNYIVRTPDRRKNTQLCHINMLKSYVNRDKNTVVQCTNIVSPLILYVIHKIHKTLKIKLLVFCIFKIRTFFYNFDSKLEHLEDSKILKNKHSKNLYMIKNFCCLMSHQEQTYVY